jgi:hypothetical protein
LLKGDVDKMIEVMRSHFASIPHDWYRKNKIDKYEGYYPSVFYSYFASIGVDVRTEDTTNQGRLDMAVIMPKAIYLFEFKCLGGKGLRVRGSDVGKINRAKKKELSAMGQLKIRGYAEKYKALNRPIYLIGIDFDQKKRNIVTYKWEAIETMASVQALGQTQTPKKKG